MRINVNVPGLRALNSANAADKQMGRLSRQLSTGARISSSRDDPAGKAVSTKLQYQIDGTKMAAQNTLNGISVLQTAEAGLTEMQSMLHRMRELAVQSANDTNTSNDRLKIQTEIEQLKQEIDSVSEKTEYNRIKLLNGHAGLKGASDDATVTGITNNMQPGVYEITVSAATAAFEPITPTGAPGVPLSDFGKVVINGVEIDINITDTYESAWEKFEEAARSVGISIHQDAGGNMRVQQDYLGNDHVIEISSDTPALMTWFGFSSASVSVSGTDATATVTAPVNSGLTVSQIDGNRVTLTGPSQQQMVVEVNGDPAAIPPGTQSLSGSIEVTITDNRLVFQTGANKDNNVEVSLDEVTARSLGVDRVSVSTDELATEAIKTLDLAIDRCAGVRSRLGSFLNRFELINTGLETADLTLQATVAKVFDTDMAYDMAEYSRQEIVNRSALAILSQANQRPQSMLQLIR